MIKVPICNMEVTRDEAVALEHNGQTVYFCSEGCRDTYLERNEDREARRDHELIIIGGGPAGLTAAVYAATLKIDAFVVAADLGGQAVDSTKIKNYMGYDFITGPELSQKFRDQLLHSNYLSHLMTEAEGLAETKNGFAVTVSDRSVFAARSVILATGMSRRQLGVPGEEEFQRRGVLYGNVQDASFVQGRDTVVIGGGNSAMQIVDNLVTVARSVQIVSNLPLKKTADAKDVERLLGCRNVTAYEGCKVEEIRGSDTVEEVVIRQLASDRGRTLSAGGVFIAVGMQPNSAIAADLVEFNERAEVKIAPDCSTSTPGLFAAGDVTDAYGKRIIIAAGEGAKAALAARQYLLNQRKQRSKTS